MLNSVLLSSAKKVMDVQYPAQFFMSVRFISAAEGSKFSYYPAFIDSFHLVKAYDENFADEFDLNMTISPRDYALMQDQGQDLLCVVTITYTDRFGNQVFDPPPRQKQYNVVINNARDIRKAIPDIEQYVEPQEPMSVRLIEPVVYALRHTKLNSIYPTTNIEQAIYSITKALGIEKIHLVKPDNVHVYDHIEIGSYQSISSVYGYLQSAYGVYQKGIDFYLSDDVLFVYPAYETNPEYDKAVLFYQVDTGRYAGSNSFYRVQNKDVSIVVNSQPHSMDLSISGAENVGTGFIFNRASRLSDGFTAVDSKNGAQFTEDTALAINLDGARTATKGVNNIFHVHGTDNPFPQMSKLIENQASIMMVEWPNCDPFLLDPCQKVAYHYDLNGVMMKKTGKLENAIYKISKIRRVDGRDWFGCSGVLTLRLSPNETQVL